MEGNAKQVYSWRNDQRHIRLRERVLLSCCLGEGLQLNCLSFVDVKDDEIEVSDQGVRDRDIQDVQQGLCRQEVSC